MRFTWFEGTFLEERPQNPIETRTEAHLSSIPPAAKLGSGKQGRSAARVTQVLAKNGDRLMDTQNDKDCVLLKVANPEVIA